MLLRGTLLRGFAGFLILLPCTKVSDENMRGEMAFPLWSTQHRGHRWAILKIFIKRAMDLQHSPSLWSVIVVG